MEYGSEFPEQKYTRRCPGACSFVAPSREEWDETPAPSHCPNCGLPLERISCPSCGAPVMWEQVPTQTGGWRLRKAPHCAFCGEKTEVAEKAMRKKPRPLRHDGTAEPEDLEARLKRKMNGGK